MMNLRSQIGRLTGLVIVTATAVAVAVLVTAGGWGDNESSGDDQPERKIPPTPVSIEEVQIERIAITDSYSGIIRPWERYSLGFEVAGRVVADKQQLASLPDEGDIVGASDVLARLDDEAFRLQLAEATAQVAEVRARLTDAQARLRQANLDLARSQRLRLHGGGVITDSAYESDKTQVTVAEAQVSMAEAQLEVAQARVKIAEKSRRDTELVMPNVPPAVANVAQRLVVSKRLVDPGESVTPNQIVMEVIQVDTVLLVVGVPEAYIGDVRPMQQVRVDLLARNRYGRARRSRDGWVRRVAEAADETTGLFDVEIGVDNSDGTWKPGLIAMAHIVLEEIDGYRVPVANTLRLKYDAARKDEQLCKDKELLTRLEDEREEVLFVYTIDGDGKARRQVLGDWVEQGSDVVVRAHSLPADCRQIVCQGQHRLVAGREVNVLNRPRPDGKKPSPAERTPASVAESKTQQGRGS
ncbi:MAG: HlyD family efflux transporter periplasmic adaptor subunit [Candidatus Nealsonbacteria bacterium]|nr:HlyD family efflux transporter periplasmic adaptor subunit [Candidatus Nealsonbacteria bacterium]